MKIHVHFFQINKEFSQEFADEHHEGKESPDNMKFWWEDAFSTKSDIFKVSNPIEGDFELVAIINEEQQHFQIPNVMKLQLLGDDNQVTEIAVSKSLLDHYEEVKQDDNNLKLNFYLKDDTVFTRPVPGQYFEIDDFPKSLKK